MSSRLRLAVILGTMAAAVAVLWFLFPWAQVKRADARIYSANSHIEEANRLMSRIEFDKLGPGHFSSLESIESARGILDDATPALAGASAEIDLATADAEAAAGLARLPQWYRDYLAQKQEISGLRKSQVAALEEVTAGLKQLYESGPLVFRSAGDMDRLLGQLESALEKSQSAPAEAASMLGPVRQSMQQVRQELESGYQKSGFDLLEQMAKSVASDIEVADLVGQFAAAAGAGDQDRAQQLMVELDSRSPAWGNGDDALNLWWLNEIKPLTSEFKELQSRQEELDARAAELYRQR